MEKTKLKNRIFIAVFLLMILAPFVCMIFYRTDMSVEKRTAAPFPKLTTYEGKLNLKYFENLNDYFNDHFAFRQEMTTIDATLTTKLLNTSLNDDVVYGKDGWLYYTETMDEYFGRNVLSDRGIRNSVRSLALMQEYAENEDVDFLFMVAPIKAYLYPEHLPDNYKQGSTINNWSKLKPAMDKEGIRYVDLHKAFSEDERVMYHKLDTHWNDEGAAFAMMQIQKAVGRDYTDYDNISYDVDKVFRGDVYGMLYPKGKTLDDNVIYSEGHHFTYVTDTKDTEDFNIQTECEGKEGTLLMFRDSYGNALIPFMADEYENAYFTKLMPFDFNRISEYNCDVVMCELTQRHITYLWEYLPVMDAPLRDNVPEDPVSYKKESGAPSEEDRVTLNIEKDPSGKLIVYGDLDPEYTGVDSHVYVRITDSQYISDYEAFPVGYNASTNKEGNKDYMYGMYIDPANLEPGECTFEVITEKDGTYYTSGTIYNFVN